MDLSKAKVSLKSVRPFLLLEISLTLLKWMGTWAPTHMKFVRQLSFVYASCFFVFLLGSFFIVETVDIIIYWGDIDKLAAGAPLLLTNLAHAFKFFTVNRNRRKIQDLLSIIKSPTFTKYNTRYERIIMWYTWQNIFHNGIYQMLGLTTVLLWATIPVTTLINGDRQLPLDRWNPFDTSKKVVFMITWSYQVFAMSYFTVNNLAIDALISSLINVATCQFEILKWNIANIGSVEEKTLFSTSTEKEHETFSKNVNDELRCCIQHNLAIFNFIKEVEQIFGSAVGFQLSVNCFITCLSTFYVSQLTTYIPAEIIGTFTYIFCMTYQSFIYCWSGNELFLQNENLSLAVYMGNWWRLETRFIRNFQIIMVRTRRPLIMTTPFLLKLVASTFVSVIQTSYSIFTLLHKKNA